MHAENDNWLDDPTAAEVQAKDRPPSDEKDAAFATTLSQGRYLARLQDADNQGQGLSA
ncbi:MAG: hypothetical protein R3F53_08635 [Gammaproteobacteria bacterium]